VSKSIQVLTSESAQGPVYIRFSDEPIANTEPTEFEDDLVVDFDAAGGVVGIELVSTGLEVLEALVKVARENNLDLTALVTRSFATPAPV
jgi:uncharacterized protein YuzE